MPVHFHIGASLTTMTYFGTYPWESQDDDTKLAIGGTLLFIGNARVVTNIILSGMLERHPALQMVSVESGVGWIPFILEALDYEMSENAPKQLEQALHAAVGVLQAPFFATFWFEKNNVPALVESVGEDCILFETDFPHPTCLYPKPLETVAEKMSTLTPTAQRKILGRERRQAVPAVTRPGAASDRWPGWAAVADGPRSFASTAAGSALGTRRPHAPAQVARWSGIRAASPMSCLPDGPLTAGRFGFGEAQPTFISLIHFPHLALMSPRFNGPRRKSR